MAKSKYNKDFPLLAEGFAREGLNDIEIGKKLGIAKNTFYKYIKKYKDFGDALKRGKSPIDTEVENLLLKRARGYEYEEVTIEKKTNKNGEVIMKHIKKLMKHIPPDTTAQIFWLSNRKNKQWKRNPDLQSDDKNDIETVSFKYTKVD